jgi:hypothetical protein
MLPEIRDAVKKIIVDRLRRAPELVTDYMDTPEGVAGLNSQSVPTDIL